MTISLDDVPTTGHQRLYLHHVHETWRVVMAAGAAASTAGPAYWYGLTPTASASTGDTVSGVPAGAADLFEDADRYYAALRSDPAAWREELAERAVWDATLPDGLEDAPWEEPAKSHTDDTEHGG